MNSKTLFTVSLLTLLACTALGTTNYFSADTALAQSRSKPKRVNSKSPKRKPTKDTRKGDAAGDITILDENGKEVTGGFDTNDDKNSRLAGVIKMEEEESQRDPYYVAQDMAIKYFSDLGSKLGKLTAGDAEPLPKLDRNTAMHLAGTYLECTANHGTCTYILDAILESDIINARLKNKATCPNMIKFWKAWIANDFQKKQGYRIKTGHLRKVGQFKKTQLPEYLKCNKTVAREVKSPEGQTDEAFFRNRYGSESAKREAVSDTTSLLQVFKRKRIHVLGGS